MNMGRQLSSVDEYGTRLLPVAEARSRTFLRQKKEGKSHHGRYIIRASFPSCPSHAPDVDVEPEPATVSAPVPERAQRAVRGRTASSWGSRRPMRTRNRTSLEHGTEDGGGSGSGFDFGSG